jgi:hypothetical protein
MEINWAAVGALGQWAAAAATVAAVWVALRGERARLRLDVDGLDPACVAAEPPALTFQVRNLGVTNMLIDQALLLTAAGVPVSDGKGRPLLSLLEGAELHQFGHLSVSLSATALADALASAGPASLYFLVIDVFGRRHRRRFSFDPTPWASTKLRGAANGP